VFAIGAARGRARLVRGRIGNRRDRLCGRDLGNYAIRAQPPLVSPPSQHDRRPFAELVVSSARATSIPFASWVRASCSSCSGSDRRCLRGTRRPAARDPLYQRSAYQALRAMRLALTDPLSGLGNHRSFQERLKHELLRAEADDEPFTLCMIDVDDFKRINDSTGTRSATACSPVSGGGCARTARPSGWAATSSLCLPGVTADEALSLPRQSSPASARSSLPTSVR
jgi:hypothetical protein